jgi:hypothetical protein
MKTHALGRLARLKVFTLALFCLPSSLWAVGVSLTPGNIIVHNSQSSGIDDLFEYTPSGVRVQTIPIVPYLGGQDLVIDRDGRANINNSPTLEIITPSTGSLTTRTFDGWTTVGNLTYGGITAFDRYVYAADMNTSGDGAPQGVVRFDLDGGATTRFATSADPLDLNIGLDGLLYTLSRGSAFNGGGNRVDVFDPISMTFIRGLDLPEEHRGIAVDWNGHIYTAQRDNVSRVNHFSAAGVLLDQIPDPGVGGFADIDINRKGEIVIASHGGKLLMTTTALDSIASFTTRLSSGTCFASWIPGPVPEPNSFVLALVAAVVTHRRSPFAHGGRRRNMRSAQ